MSDAWIAVLLTILIGLEVIYMISRIGQPREPITPYLVICGMIEWGLIVWGLWVLAT